MKAGRVAFLVGTFATHVVVGYALIHGFIDVDPRLGIAFGLLPDVDFWFPGTWAGRSFTAHSPYAAVHGRDLLRANDPLPIGLGSGCILAIDSLSPTGIDWLYLLEISARPRLPVHGLAATALLWAASIAVLVWRTDDLPSIR